MSRTDRKEIIEYPLPVYNPDPKIHLIDADSIVYIANSGSEEDIEYAKLKVDEKFKEILTNVEQCFNIVQTLIFIKGENNFRYKVDSAYKSNRPPKHPNIILLYEYIKNTYDNVIVANNYEAEDYLYTAWKLAGANNVVISGIDKDLKSSCYGQFYDYKKQMFTYITEKEQRYNLAKHILMGDSSDGILGIKGIGPKKAEKIVNIDMNKYQYIKAIYTKYKEVYNTEAKEKLTSTYFLIKLHNISDKISEMSYFWENMRSGKHIQIN